MPHYCDIKVRFCELDPYGHVNHSVFIQYFETGRVDMLEEIGFRLDVFADRGYQFVVTRISTDFLRPVRAGDMVTVATEVLRVRRASSVWRQRLIRCGEVVARQESQIAITDLAGKPVRAPSHLGDKLAPYKVSA